MNSEHAPKCFSDHSDFVIWMKYDSVSCSNGHKSNGFVCKDCSADFQSAMLREGRCDHPEVVFGMIEKKYGGVIEEEFGGYIPIGPKAKLTNGYLPDAKKSEVAQGSGLQPRGDHRASESIEVRLG